MNGLSTGKILILLSGLAIVCSIAVFVFSVSSGREIAIRSWEIVRQEMLNTITSRDWSRAERLSRKGVDLATGIAADDFRVAVSLSDLGDMLFAQEKNKEALDAYKRASDIEKTTATRNTADGAELFSESHLGHLFYQMGRTAILINNPKQASRYLKKSASAFESIRKGAAKKDLFIAQELVRTIIAQAEAANLLNQKDERLRFLRKALKLCGECYYPAQEVASLRKDYTQLATATGQTVETSCSESTWAQLVEKANAALDAGQLIDYQRLLRESITGCEGEKSRQILALISLRKLAKFYVAQRRPADAIDTCKKGLAVYRDMGDGGDSEADVLYTMLYRSTTDPREREAIERLQLELRIKLYGPDDFHVAETSTRLAVLTYLLGDRTTTKTCINRAYEIYNQARLKRRGVGTDLIDLGNLLLEFGEYKKAENMYQRALKIWSKGSNKHVALRIDVLKRLHRVYEKLDLRMEMNRVDEERMQLEQLPAAR